MLEPPLLIDTMRVSGPVDGLSDLGALRNARADSSVALGTGEIIKNHRRATLASGVTIGVYEGPTGSRGWLEASLPRLRHGSNENALPYDEAMKTAENMVEEARAYLPWSLPFADLTLARVDLVLDVHGVTQLDALMTLWVASGRPVSAHLEKGRFQSLTYGARAYRSVLAYDKTVQMRPKVRPGEPRQLRIETRLQRSCLKRQGIDFIGEATEERLDAQRLKAFNAHGFSRGIISLRSTYRVIQESQYTDSIKAGMFWLTTSENHGDDTFHGNTRRDHRRRLSDLGLGSGEPIFAAARIDYRSASEILT
jgi:hypothetical protein